MSVNNKPTTLAYSKGLTIIPFENVEAVSESYQESGQLLVCLTNKESITLDKDETLDFISKYNYYLRFIELNLVNGDE